MSVEAVMAIGGIVAVMLWASIAIKSRKPEEPVDELNEPLERRSVMGRMWERD